MGAEGYVPRVPDPVSRQIRRLIEPDSVEIGLFIGEFLSPNY